MNYRNDIFISYKRNTETLRWIKDHFLPLLSLRVEFELGRDVNIYLDQQLEAGASWPLQLGTELGYSRILVPLWTRTYFSSKWCTREMSHMLAREREVGCRTPQNSQGLIVPAVIHDGDTFPHDLGHIQRFEIQRYFNVRMSTYSPRAEELAEILSREAPALAKAIDNAPLWRPQWPEQVAAEFYEQFYQEEEPSQGILPRFTR